MLRSNSKKMRLTFSQGNMIDVDGEAEFVNQLFQPLSDQPWMKHIYHDADGRMIDQDSFSIGTWCLKMKAGRSASSPFMAEYMLNFITTNEKQIDISETDRWLFEYWAYEMQMIKEKNSYRSFVQDRFELTAMNILNNIVAAGLKKQCVLSVKDVFEFVENFKAIKEIAHVTPSPCWPHLYEIELFIEAKMKIKESSEELIKNARVFAQALRDTNCLFFKTISKDAAIKIAAYTANPMAHGSQQAAEIVKKNFNRPLIKK